MFLLFRCLIVSIGLLVLASCSSGGQWQHSSKTIYEFHADDRECQQLSLARAKQASLVPQPVLQEYLSRYERCLLAQGWTPLQVIDYTPPSVKVVRTEEGLTFSTNRMHLTLPGPSELLTQQQNEFLTQKAETYLYLIFQLEYPAKLIREVPPKINPSTYFDRYQKGNVFARFFSQYKDHQLIFACTAYLFADDNNRIVVSLSRAFDSMPENLMALSAPQFEQLRATQKQWETQLQQLSEQFR